MWTHRRFSLVSFCVVGSTLLLQGLVTGCSREKNQGAGNPQPVAGVAGQPSSADGPAIKKAGVNPPNSGSFTCWIKGSGFREGDRVLINGAAEVPSTLGGPDLVTFVAPATLLEGHTSLTLAVFRPGTQIRSNSFEVLIPSVPAGS